MKTPLFGKVQSLGHPRIKPSSGSGNKKPQEKSLGPPGENLVGQCYIITSIASRCEYSPLCKPKNLAFLHCSSSSNICWGLWGFFQHKLREASFKIHMACHQNVQVPEIEELCLRWVRIPLHGPDLLTLVECLVFWGYLERRYRIYPQTSCGIPYTL